MLFRSSEFGTWLARRTASAVEAVDHALGSYSFSEAAQRVHDAIWSDFCDQAIELAKVTLGDAQRPAEERVATWWSLVDALDVRLRLLHPIAPFISEGIWEALPRRGDDPAMLAIAAWPALGPAASSADSASAAAIDRWLDLVREVRAARTAMKAPASAWLPLEVSAPKELAPIGQRLADAIGRLARVRPLTILTGDLGARPGALVVAGPLTARLHLPEADPATLAADRARRERDLAQAREQLASAEARLADPAFTDKAPERVVAGARRRVEELRGEIARLEGDPS